MAQRRIALANSGDMKLTGGMEVVWKGGDVSCGYTIFCLRAFITASDLELTLSFL